MARKTRQSRRQTPWDGTDMSPTQRFIYDQHQIHYEQRHPSLLESGESKFMEPVNRVHYYLKDFLNAHSDFNRDELQGYLNLYAFVSNPPADYLEKVEKLIKMVFEKPKSLRYRDQFG